MPAPTNRPFFSNFLAAFRAHQSVHHAVKSASSTALTGTTSQSSTHGATTLRTTTSSDPSQQTRTIVTTTKTSQPQQSSNAASGPAGVGGATTMAISPHPFQPHTHRHHSVSPYSRSPGSVSPVGSPGFQHQQQRGRRGSDSSNEGFRDARGSGEKWYIGGRTAQGEERFYKLSMVKRPRSVDALSADRMSL